ncbi:MAG: DUF4330 domain-containing protein [Clostridiales bacterium]|jgi:hypothetical protein|nr:DUF4330 domain-containing protein [Clostridiales bacterium]
MKLINEKGKLFGMINVLDLLFLAVIVLGLIVGYKYFSGSAVDGVQGNVYFEVEFKSVKQDFADKIQKGDEIKDSIKGYYLGKVSDIKISPEESTNWDAVAQKFVTVQSPEDVTVLVEVLANGAKNDEDGFIYAESQPVSVGREMFIKGKGYAHAGYITKVVFEEPEVE